jgi:hypothetical protein
LGRTSINILCVAVDQVVVPSLFFSGFVLPINYNPINYNPKGALIRSLPNGKTVYSSSFEAGSDQSHDQTWIKKIMIKGSTTAAATNAEPIGTNPKYQRPCKCVTQANICYMCNRAGIRLEGGRY